ncbi:hypothetical protein [Mesorhizobium sp.]|uniref:hypothetical protein n=1 Tax=Mesorhizobium sp. TaxID=1871066 RepID=UPI002579E734|nr:hypothetical protein [Mesorhizobium sp.]
MVFTSKAETLAWCCSGLLLAQIQLAGETAIVGKLFHQPLAKIAEPCDWPPVRKKSCWNN